MLTPDHRCLDCRARSRDHGVPLDSPTPVPVGRTPQLGKRFAVMWELLTGVLSGGMFLEDVGAHGKPQSERVSLFTMALDPTTHRIYLAAAKFQAALPGGRPQVVPNNSVCAAGIFVQVWAVAGVAQKTTLAMAGPAEPCEPAAPGLPCGP